MDSFVIDGWKVPTQDQNFRLSPFDPPYSVRMFANIKKEEREEKKDSVKWEFSEFPFLQKQFILEE